MLLDTRGGLCVRVRVRGRVGGGFILWRVKFDYVRLLWANTEKVLSGDAVWRTSGEAGMLLDTHVGLCVRLWHSVESVLAR